MKVLYLSHMYPFAAAPTFGLFVHNQAKALAKHCPLVVLSPTPAVPPMMRHMKARWAQYASKPGRSELEGITVYYPRYANIPGKHGYLPGVFAVLLATASLVRSLKESFGFDLIHAHGICLDGPAAVCMGRAVGSPVVCTMHGSDVSIFPQRSRPTRIAAQWAIRRADALVAVSAELKGRALALGAPKREITIVPSGVDLDQFSPMGQQEARARLGLPDDRNGGKAGTRSIRQW